ncbi:hypothetical protein, partial [Pseudomonas sp. NCHU5216]|uniref:hypothetical protein n=1 Tax=Pseudomonas sp. NCHU5216 TaxID=3451355 RepID=UPI003F98852D
MDVLQRRKKKLLRGIMGKSGLISDWQVCVLFSVFKLLIGVLLMSPVSPPGDLLLSNATKEGKKAWPRHP